MEKPTRTYRAIGRVSNEDAEEAFHRNDPAELVIVVIGVGLHSEEFEWAEDFCLRLAEHSDAYVRGDAILSLGYLARRFRKLGKNSVDAVREGLNDSDAFVRGHADDAADAIEHFTKLSVRTTA